VFFRGKRRILRRGMSIRVPRNTAGQSVNQSKHVCIHCEQVLAAVMAVAARNNESRMNVDVSASSVAGPE